MHATNRHSYHGAYDSLAGYSNSQSAMIRKATGTKLRKMDPWAGVAGSKPHAGRQVATSRPMTSHGRRGDDYSTRSVNGSRTSGIAAPCDNYFTARPVPGAGGEPRHSSGYALREASDMYRQAGHDGGDLLAQQRAYREQVRSNRLEANAPVLVSHRRGSVYVEQAHRPHETGLDLVRRQHALGRAEEERAARRGYEPFQDDRYFDDKQPRGMGTYDALEVGSYHSPKPSGKYSKLDDVPMYVLTSRDPDRFVVGAYQGNKVKHKVKPAGPGYDVVRTPSKPKKSHQRSASCSGKILRSLCSR